MYEIGGADVTTYGEMIARYAEVRGLRRRRIVDIPLLTPHLSSYWVDLVTPVDRSVSHALIESLTTEVVVTAPDPPAGRSRWSRWAWPTPCAGRWTTRPARDPPLLGRQGGLADGVHTVVGELALRPTPPRTPWSGTWPPSAAG